MVNRTGKRRRLPEELFESETDEEEEDYETDLLEEIDGNEQERIKPPVQRRPNKEQNHLLGHEKLLQDYFNEDCTYNKTDFARRFQMRKEHFLKIADEVENVCPYFIQKRVSCYSFIIFSTKN
jgi:hypothetical protein